MSEKKPSARGYAYGLEILSDIPLPVLGPGRQGHEVDITICQGTVEYSTGDGPMNLNDFVRSDDGGLWLNIPDMIAMRIERGERITYAPYPAARDDDVRAFVLGSGLGAILMQRDNLVLHANAIAMPDGAALICMGQSGAGKSTTAAALMKLGYTVLTDDVCAVGADGVIRPGIPRLKLCQDAIVKLGLDASRLACSDGTTYKRSLPFDAHDERLIQRPALAILLETGKVERVEARELSQSERFVALRNNLYRPAYCQALGLEPHYLRRLAALAATITAYRVTRPETGVTIECLIETILGLHRAVRSL